MEKPPLFLIVVGILIVGGLVVFGRGGGDRTPPRPAQPDSQTEAVEGAAPVDSITSQPGGPQVPDLSLTSLTGDTVNLNQFIGQKAVVVDFWASWCHNCQRDMPKMQTMYDRYKDSVEILAINLQEPKRDIERFVSSRKLTYPILLDPTDKASRQFGISYTNTHILISKSGTIIGVLPGDITEEDMKELMTAS